MPTRIGLISDIHSTVAPLQEALTIFKREKVDTIICAGDIAGYGEDELSQTIDLLRQSKCKMIAGNHDLVSEDLDCTNISEDTIDFLQALPRTLNLEIEDFKIFVVHAQPPAALHGGIKLLDPEGIALPERISHWQQELKDFEYPILIVGHTHQVFSQHIGDTLVINPGSTKYNHTCMILNLPSLQVETFALSDKPPILTWNWGKFFQEQNPKSH